VSEEQFAPALPIIPYDDIADAVEEANDTPFGLCASVWSNDDALAADVASRLSAGTVFVNAHGMSAIDMYAPMGGWKQSGFGLELGTEGMQAFARHRVRVVRPGPEAQGGTA
jgi:acyl-CoA reductase-like NAD-dependent aldehyde dehydrogenase